MSKLRHGGPAFPATTVNDSDTNITDPFGTLLPPNAQAPYSGMTLRDYFAAKAMQSIVSALASQGLLTEPESAGPVANASYLMADAMLKAREA
jgi:hypothetical protein